MSRNSFCGTFLIVYGWTVQKQLSYPGLTKPVNPNQNTGWYPTNNDLTDDGYPVYSDPNRNLTLAASSDILETFID